MHRRHRQIRDRYIPDALAGKAICSRTRLPIPKPGEPCPRCGRPMAVDGRAISGFCGVDLGHRDDDGTAPGERLETWGLELSCANRSVGGRNGGRRTAFKNVAWSRNWLDNF